MFDVETGKVIEAIEKLGKKNPKVIFQAPEGLKLSVEKEIEKIKEYFKQKGRDVELYLWGNTCFGACDLIDNHVKNLDVDLIIHYGHEKLSYANPEIKTLFIPAYHIFEKDEKEKILNDIKNFIEKQKSEGKKVAIATTVQYKKLLRDFNPSIILGCRGEVEEGDVILFVGTGRFHPLMIAYKYQKEVFIYNPVSKCFDKISEDEINKFIKKRISAISKLMLNKPEKVGVVLSTKKGQCRKKVFNEIIKLLEENNINYITVVVDNISPEMLFYDVDCYIIVACPRIVLDDYILYKKPIYTPEEFKLFLKNSFEYKFDEIKEDDF
ncbi:diphthamide biosynthesis enzyme Dph2 [Methanocaldococcus fervens]|uniref:2-(3-amino-3-carboxypropyl)histidine synthase n=1 Tax=Methanocaldococcus fervens (strain DSM 4213 / JCM 15782 / AG86) TaxID=573064 RepID=C7P7F5_METFA|nr:diphthamide biosynthesis enzyme Dph2 [Methanocaldococcus fervens]ACV24487.1 diphthamide biosynthesis protein [Methanocaldococcus fervens AG86]